MILLYSVLKILFFLLDITSITNNYFPGIFRYLRLICISMCSQASWMVLDFFLDFPGSVKSWKLTVLYS